jgi:hypothetical protein
MTLPDTGSGNNPFVGSVEILFKILVGEDFLRDIRTGTGDTRSDHGLTP